MIKGFIFAILAAISFAGLTVFHKFASRYIDPVFGALLVSLTAVIIGSIIIIPNLKTTTLISDNKGLIFILIAGVAAFFIDFLSLTAYSKGIPVSIGGPIIIGGSIAIAGFIGLFLGEPFNFYKILALLLIIAGSSILAYSG